jgi:hypothetical protein
VKNWFSLSSLCLLFSSLLFSLSLFLSLLSLFFLSLFSLVSSLCFFKFKSHRYIEDVPVEHGLLMENLLDLAHAPFTHTVGRVHVDSP